MKAFVAFCLVVTFVRIGFAFEYKVSLTSAEVKASKIVRTSPSGEISITAARVLQLQLLELDCGRVIVTPRQLEASETYEFAVDSENCVVKRKEGEMCEAGFSARNMPVNPDSSDKVVIGADKYKVCVKSAGPGTQPSHQKTGAR